MSQPVNQIRHFLDLDRFEPAELRHLIERGKALKRGDDGGTPLAGKLLAMIFEKPSTRTRVSFEAGMRQLGGSVIVLSQQDTQLGRGESIADTARVLSRMVDAIMLRALKARRCEYSSCRNSSVRPISTQDQLCS